MKYLLLHMVEIIAFAGLLWAPGFAIERAFWRHDSHVQFRGLIRLCLGTAFWTVSLFFLCTIHCLTVPMVATLALLSVAGALYFVRLRSFRFPGGCRPVPCAMAAACLLPIVAALVIAAIKSMHPVLSLDADVYHLTIPKKYIAHQGFVFIPFTVYSNWPLNGELIFALAMMLRDYILANSVQCLFGAFSAYAVFTFVRARHSIWVGFLSVLFMLFNSKFLWELSTAYVDVMCGFFLVAAFIFAVQASEKPEQRKMYLLLAGISAGILAGMKVTGFAGLVPVAMCYLLSAVERKKLRRGLRDIRIYFLSPVVLLSLPWILKAVWYTGNPVYPFLYGVFGGPDWSENCSRQFAAWQSAIGMGRSLADYLVLPLRIIVAAGPGYSHFDGTINKLWLVLVPITFVAAKRNRTVRSCLVFAVIYFVYWAASSQQMRFLLPIIPIMAIGAALAVAELTDRLIAKRTVKAASFAFIYCAVSALLVVEIQKDFSTVEEVVSLYRKNDSKTVKEQAVPPVFGFINNQLPSDARLVFLNINVGFHCNREYIADSFFEASQIADWLSSCSSPREIASRLKERGITHILFSTNNWRIVYPPSMKDFLTDTSLVQLIGESPDNSLNLYVLK